ncbi:hypothetical protein C2S52_015531 [Perilla frutescens var. hirtella]|uniref:Uncharacterized protein n=1 Tax=Perilla frutescens var. hirtella TaxID=608512 RepID=A0AAD4IPE7_PERFH|nr:hypothetical protein C2S53_002705 [Perilla frutescens var. hirtella]KAH6770728.1 hypothetical protein C2S52_015531 [Perilla frutescens var. hirtella]KAH6815652.1 hypothetical protein C2S51_020472 [Perilla frutescens var. frutescens]
MASNNSHETSWADQWDSQPTYSYTTFSDSGNSSSSKFSAKLKLDKTKTAASTSVKKVKAGATAGFHWIKNKYHKATHKQ